MTRHGDEDVPAPWLLPMWFEEVAARDPEHVAIEVPGASARSETQRVTYGRMLREVRRVAARLEGLASEDRVIAIVLPRAAPYLLAAQLGVQRAGAAYTCIDPSVPDGYVASVLEDCSPVAILTDAAGVDRLAALDHGAEVIDVAAMLADADLDSPVDLPPCTVEPQHLAYVIYTSGTTGDPKGVMIEHGSVAHLAWDDLQEFDLTPADRVVQGSSPAYDSSVEETWLALAAGATLVLMDEATARLGPDLPEWMRRHRVTVFCPTPTLLRMTGCRDPEQELPDLRVLYVGGEALSAELADRWAPGRRLENGYGPTECTVTVLRKTLHAGEAVTIGGPRRGHRAWIVDPDSLELVDGAEGELCIGGIGVARGYLGRPDATAERFVDHPTLGRLYRTGDHVRRTPAGDIAYLGRLDAQVKVRGHRVELGAIEAALAAAPGVAGAGCRVQGTGAAAVLAGFVVPVDETAPPDLDELRRTLGETLPAAMVPGRLGFIDQLPTTVGGKLDRSRLPGAVAPASVTGTGTGACTATVTATADPRGAFAVALGLSELPPSDADFFLDLGGDSLSAVSVVIALREADPACPVTTRDVYESRTAARLSERLASVSASASAAGGGPGGVSDPPPVPPNRVSERGVRVATALQAAWLLLWFTVGTALLYAIIYVALPAVLSALGLALTFLLVPLLLDGLRLAWTGPAIALAAAAKRLLVGRYQPESIPVWSARFVRHWCAARVAGLIPWGFLAGTVFTAIPLRALGATVGRRVHVHRGVAFTGGGWDLLHLGDDVTLAQDAVIGVVEHDRGHVCLGHVHVGDGATVDVRATLSRGTTLGARSRVGPLSWIAHGTHVPAGEHWDGVPAGRTGSVGSVGSRPLPRPMSDGEAAALSPGIHGVLLIAARSALALLTWLPVALALLAVVAAAGVDEAAVRTWILAPQWSFPAMAVLLAITVLGPPASLAVSAVALRVLGNVRPTTMSRWSLGYIRVWLATARVEAAGRWLSGTVYWPLWLRLAGMRIGRRCEVSSIIDVLPARIAIGADSFFADGIYLGSPVVHRGAVTVADATIGRGSFIANHVVLPAGATYPDGAFIGVSTVADAPTMRPDTGWFGHPAMELPRREVAASAADRSQTFEPAPARWAARLFWETARFTLPLLPLLVVAGWLELIEMWRGSTAGVVVAAATAATAAAILAPCLALLAVKWSLLGRVRPGTHPLWSCWCSRWDFVYVAWQFWARSILVQLEGTLLLNAFLRAVGMDIGRRVVLGPGFAQVVDPDMLHFADRSTVSTMFQAHSFEDRVLKIDHVHIGPGATAGAAGVVFYGATLGDGAWLAPSTVVMKRERIAADSVSAGVPAQTRAPTPTQSPTPAPIPIPATG